MPGVVPSERRESAVRKILAEHEAGAAIVTHLAHIRWLTGFSGSAALSIITGKDHHLVTDGRYSVQAAGEVRTAELHIADGDLYEFVAKHNLVRDENRVLVQAEYLSTRDLRRLERLLDGATLLETEGALDELVASKDDEEIRSIRGAQAISEDVYEYLLGWIKEGFSERDIATEIVYQHLRGGADGMAFDPIVASGPNSAKPHATPSSRRVTSDDVLLLDFGCRVNGYSSDMTRTVSLGAPCDEVVRVHAVVVEAMCRAEEQARAGWPAARLDAIAREVIERAGFGKHFSHSLGHGVGLQIHEYPRVSRTSRHRLPDRCVITLEPGVYLPGQFGVRVEDMVQLHPDGCDKLTSVPRALTIL